MSTRRPSPQPAPSGRPRIRRRWILAGALAVSLLLLWLSLPALILGGLRSLVAGQLHIGRLTLALDHVTMEDVSLSPSGKAPVVTVEKIEVAFNLGDLLWNHSPVHAMERVVIRKPTVTAAVDAQGAFDVAALFRVPPSFLIPPRPGEVFRGAVLLQDGVVSLTDVRAPGFSARLEDIQGEAHFNQGGEGRFAATCSESENGAAAHFTLNGIGNQSQLRWKARLAVHGLSLARWGTYAMNNPGLRVLEGRGDLYLDAWAGLSNGAPVVDCTGTLRGRGISLKLDPLPDPIQEVGGTLILSNNMMRASGLTGRYQEAALELGGRIFSFADPQLDLRITLHHLPLSAINAYLPKSSPPLAGWGAGALHVAGPNLTPRIEGFLSSPQCRVGPEVVTDAGVRFRLDGDVLRVQAASAHWRGSRMAADGAIILGKHPVALVALSGREIPLSLAGSGALAGHGDFQVLALGDAASPLVTGTATIRQGALFGLPVSLGTGRFVYDRQALWLHGIELGAGGGRLSVSHGLIDFRRPFLNVLAASKGYPIPLARFGINASGALSGSLWIGGSPAAPAGYGVVQGGGLSWAGGGATALAGGVGFAGQSWEANVTGRMGRGRLAVTAQGAPTWLQVDAQARSVNLASMRRPLPFGDQIPLRGTGDVGLRLNGNPRGDLGFRSWLRTGAGTAGALGSVNLAAPGDLFAAVWYDNLNVRNVDVAALSPAQPRGALTGQAWITGHGSRVAVEASARVRRGSIAGMPVSWLWMDANTSGPSVAVRHLSIAGPGGSMEAKGSVDTRRRRMDLAIEGWDLDLSALQRAPFGRVLRQGLGWGTLGGLAKVTGRLAGPWASPVLFAVVDVRDGTLNHEAFSLSGRARLSASGLRLDALDVTQGLGRYHASGAIRFGNQVGLGLRLTVSHGSLGRLLAFTPWRNWPLEGEMNGSLSLTGTLENPLINGSIALADAQIAGQPVQSLTADFKSTATILVLERLHMVVKDGVVDGSAAFSAAGPIDVHLTAANFPLEDLEFLFPVTGPLTGRGDVTVTATGHRQAPRVAMSLHARAVGLRGEHFDEVEGNVVWDKGRVDLSSVQLVSGSRRYALNGEIQLPGNIFPLSYREWWGAKESQAPVFSLNVQVDNGDLGQVLRVLDFPAKDQFAGRLDGGLELKGTLRHPRFILDAALENGVVAGAPLDALVVKVNFDYPYLEFEDVHLASRNGQATLSGDVDLTKSMQVTLKADGVDMRILHPFIPALSPLSGRLSAELTANGLTRSPDVAASLEVSKGSWGGFGFDRLSGQVHASQGLVTLEKVQIAQGAHAAHLSGTIPLVWTGTAFASTQPMDIAADFDETDLGILSVFAPGVVESSNGRVTGVAHITGPPGGVQVTGRLTASHVNATLRGLESPVEDVNADVTFTGNQIAFNRMIGFVGGGQVEMGGTVGLADGGLTNYDLRLDSDHAVFSVPQWGKAKVQASLRLVGEGPVPTLKGTVHLSDSTLQLSSLVAAAAAPASPAAWGLLAIEPALDVRVAAGDNCWLHYQRSALEVSGALAVTGQWPRALSVAGELDSSRGTFNVLETNFKVTQGRAIFSGGSLIPLVDMSAETSLGSTKIFIDVTGSLDRPELQLSSDPPMSRSEIANLLGGKVLGGGPGGIIAQPFVNVLQTELLTPLAQVISRTFSFSEVSFEYTLPGYYTLRIAKALDARERFLATYSRVFGALGEIQRLWGLEYRISRWGELRISVDDKGNLNFGIQGRRIF